MVDDLNEVQIRAPRIRNGVAHLALPPRAQNLEDQGLSPVNLLDDLDVVLVAAEGLHQDEVVPLRNDDRTAGVLSAILTICKRNQ